MKIHMICGCLLDVCSERYFGGKVLTISLGEKQLTYVFSKQCSLILCNGGVGVAAVFCLGLHKADFQACLAGHEDVVQLLLAKGASAKANEWRVEWLATSLYYFLWGSPLAIFKYH